MTWMEYKRLPEMLRPERLRQISGLTKETIAVLASSGELRVWRTPGGHRRFYKSDLKRVMELEVED
jgi:excisionase family DNA binding protein